jgi:hypothetical protein
MSPVSTCNTAGVGSIGNGDVNLIEHDACAWQHATTYFLADAKNDGACAEHTDRQVVSTSSFDDHHLSLCLALLIANGRSANYIPKNNEYALSLSQHTIHTRRLSDFSRGWQSNYQTSLLKTRM